MSTNGTVSKYLDIVSTAYLPVIKWMEDNNIKGRIKIETPSSHLCMDMESLPTVFMGCEILWVN